MNPEELARKNIDGQLAQTGWFVQDRAQMKLYAGHGVAVREFPVEGGFADYMLFADRKAARAVEATAEAGLKRAGRLRHESPSGEAVLRAAFEGRL